MNDDNRHPLSLDPTKHYLQISFWPTDRVQPHPDMALHPFDTDRQVRDCFNSYVGNPSFNIAQAHFLRPGQPLMPYVLGGASDPLDPDRWHLHVEYEGRRPIRQGVVPTMVVAPHDDHVRASVDFDRYRSHVAGGGGRMLYAAILPPANSGRPPIVIVQRRG